MLNQLKRKNSRFSNIAFFQKSFEKLAWSNVNYSGNDRMSMVLHVVFVKSWWCRNWVNSNDNWNFPYCTTPRMSSRSNLRNKCYYNKLLQATFWWKSRSIIIWCFQMGQKCEKNVLFAIKIFWLGIVLTKRNFCAKVLYKTWKPMKSKRLDQGFLSQKKAHFFRFLCSVFAHLKSYEH